MAYLILYLRFSILVLLISLGEGVRGLLGGYHRAKGIVIPPFFWSVPSDCIGPSRGGSPHPTIVSLHINTLLLESIILCISPNVNGIHP